MTVREANRDAGIVEPPMEAPPPVYIALGSNLGDREANLRLAVERMASAGLAVVRQSSIYETEPVGFAGQDWFLNQVVETRLSDAVTAGDLRSASRVEEGSGLANRLVQVLARLLEIENDMGRRRELQYGPRPIDLDILLCGSLSGVFHLRSGDAGSPGGLNEAAGPLLELILPHPRMHQRRFVLAPLCEIAPSVMHPTLKTTCAELLAQLDDPSRIRKR